MIGQKGGTWYYKTRRKNRHKQTKKNFERKFKKIVDMC